MYTGNLAPIVNSNHWIDAFGIVDVEQGGPIDITDATEIEVKIRHQESDCDVLFAQLSDGSVEIVEIGTFQWTFTPAQLGSLRAGDIYEVVATIIKDEVATTVMIARLPVLQG